MAQRCKKCGTFLTDTDRFCPNCGENVPPPEPAQTVYQAPPVPQSGMGTPPPPPVPPYPPVRPVYEEELSLGKWVLTLFVTNFLGVISWIFLFIWGFGVGPESRRRYCKAMLIVKAIGTVVVILFAVFYASVLFSALEGYAGYGDYGDYTYAALSVFPRLLG